MREPPGGLAESTRVAHFPLDCPTAGKYAAPMDIEKLIKAAENLGIGPVELARRAGISRRNLHLILHRGSCPKLPTLAKLASAVGLRAVDLVLP